MDFVRIPVVLGTALTLAARMGAVAGRVQTTVVHNRVALPIAVHPRVVTAERVVRLAIHAAALARVAVSEDADPVRTVATKSAGRAAHTPVARITAALLRAAMQIAAIVHAVTLRIPVVPAGIIAAVVRAAILRTVVARRVRVLDVPVTAVPENVAVRVSRVVRRPRHVARPVAIASVVRTLEIQVERPAMELGINKGVRTAHVAAHVVRGCAATILRASRHLQKR